VKKFTIAIVIFCASLLAVEGDKYRLLSLSNSGKLILISQIPNKTKYVLDATTAKITLDGKPAEFTTLNNYSIIHVDYDAKKGQKNGINIDGIAKEIRISTPENPKPQPKP
jgi:hypothetical protein